MDRKNSNPLSNWTIQRKTVLREATMWIHQSPLPPPFDCIVIADNNNMNTVVNDPLLQTGAVNTAPTQHQTYENNPDSGFVIELKNEKRMDESKPPSCPHNLPTLLHGVSTAKDPIHAWHFLQEIQHILSIQDVFHSISDVALDAHADVILCNQLHYIVVTRQQQELPQYHNSQKRHSPYPINNAPFLLPLLLECLHLLWSRASSNRRQTSLRLHAKTTINDLVVLWYWYRYDNHILQALLSVLRLFTRPHRDVALRQTLVMQQPTALFDRIIAAACNEIAMDNPLRPLVLSLIKDLSFRASTQHQTILYNKFKPLVLAHLRDPTPTIVEHMLATMWNWASVESVGQLMAADDSVWNVLRDLLTKSPASNLQPRSNPLTLTCQRHATAALGSMISACTTSLDNGSHSLLVQQSWLIVYLVQVLSSEHDIDWRRRCVRSLRCLTSCEWGLKFVWKQLQSSSSCEDFADMLIAIMQDNDDETDTRVHACQTLNSLLVLAPINNVAENDKIWNSESIDPYLEKSILELIESNNTEPKLVVAACQTMRLLLQYSPWRCNLSSFSKHFHEAIHAAIDDDNNEIALSPEYHLVLAELLLQITRLCVAQKDFTTILEGKALSTVSILLSRVGPDFEDSRRIAVNIVSTIMEGNSHAKLLAGNETLLTALVNFCLLARGDLKDEAKKIVMALVPEL